jgi:hypothetical protein
MTWLAVVSGILSILSFLFAVWIWLRSDLKVRELLGTIHALHDMADSVVWNLQMLRGEDSEARLLQVEKSVGIVSGMRILTSKYAGDRQNFADTEPGILVQRGIIWSNGMLTRLEASHEIREVWLVTPDLEPDLSEASTQGIVKKNIKAGKRYIYFYPKELLGAQEKIQRLLRGIGADNPKLARNVSFVGLDETVDRRIRSRANTILFFKDDPAYGTDLVFEEVVFTQVSQRGVFWQEHDPQYAEMAYDLLRRQVGAGGQGELAAS